MNDRSIKVTLLMAITLDGMIGKDSDHFPDWTGPEDKKLFVAITKKAGALIMGSKTFDTIGRPLPKRKNIIMTRSDRVSEWDNLEFTNQSPAKILEGLEEEGYEEVILAGGAMINSLFAKAGLIDELKVTISPLVFGEGIGLFSDDTQMDLELIEHKALGENLLYAHYKVQK